MHTECLYVLYVCVQYQCLTSINASEKLIKYNKIVGLHDKHVQCHQLDYRWSQWRGTSVQQHLYVAPLTCVGYEQRL